MTLARFKEGSHPVFPSLWEDFFGRDIDLFDMGNKPGAGSSLPAVNVKDHKGNYEIEVAAPGMNKDDFKVELNDHTLTISAEKEDKKEDKDEEGNYTRREFNYQSFQRSFTLPEYVKEEDIKANYNDGILSIKLPKKDEVKEKETKKIAIE